MVEKPAFLDLLIMQVIPEFHTFAGPEELAGHLAADIADILRQRLNKADRASLVVSGGSTPRPLFMRLSRENLPWERVTITLADERWVDTSDPESNEHLVRSLLLRDLAKEAVFIPLKNSAPTALQGEDECHINLSRITRPFEVVILGMGENGHTASFFPGAGRLPLALDLKSGRNCISITPLDAPHERMTLTLPCLLDARRIILHITGTKKRMVLEEALAEGPVADLPVRCILRQQLTPVHIYWSP